MFSLTFIAVLIFLMIGNCIIFAQNGPPPTRDELLKKYHLDNKQYGPFYGSPFGPKPTRSICRYRQDEPMYQPNYFVCVNSTCCYTMFNEPRCCGYFDGTPPPKPSFSFNETKIKYGIIAAIFLAILYRICMSGEPQYNENDNNNLVDTYLPEDFDPYVPDPIFEQNYEAYEKYILYY